MSWNPFAYRPWNVRRVGRKHGRSWRWVFFPFSKEPHNPEPPGDQRTPAAFEEQIREAARDDIEHTAREWASVDESLSQTLVAALRERHQAEASLKKEAAEAEEAVAEYNAAQGVVNSLGIPEISHRATMTWLVVLALLELPFNRVVFEIFQRGWWETTLVACLVAVAIPALAHLTGYELRQDYKNKRDVALLALGVGGAVGLIGVIAYIRSLFLEGENELEILGIHLDPRAMTVAFVLVNISVYLVAMILSYHGSHPQGKVYHQAVKRLKMAQRRLKKESGEAQQARRRLEAATKALDLARIRREKRFERLAQEAKLTIRNYEYLVRVYRMANQEVRPPDSRPPCFEGDPEPIELPEALRELREVRWAPGEGVAGAAGVAEDGGQP